MDDKPPRLLPGNEVPDLLADLRTPEARARLAVDERRIHASLIKRARRHDRVLASSRERANDRVIHSTGLVR